MLDRLGALVGLALAVLIAAIEKWAGDRLGWFEPNTTTAEETVRTPCRRLLTCEGPLRAEHAATKAKAALRC